MTALLFFVLAIGFFSLPYWLPPQIIRLRMAIFTRINGEQAIQIPNDAFSAEDFRKIYAHPSMKGRSKGAALSDLFWYWLSPGPEMHPEHLEQGQRYQSLAHLTREILAMSKADIETIIDQYDVDPLELSLHTHKNKHKTWSYIRLRDTFMPLWADFFYQVVFHQPCSETSRALIVNHANDVVSALKCCKLRNMSKRNQLTDFLLEKLSEDALPYTFPPGLSRLQQAHFLQGTFFNTAVVQMSEAMTHLFLAIAQHPACQNRLREDDSNAYLDNVINESLRLYPLFGIAHRIVTEPVEFNGETLKENTVVCFNYPDYHKIGFEKSDQFEPNRWQTCPIKHANFIPFGVSSNRSCPAQGMAMVAMRRLTKHINRNYYFESSIPHTRSLPNRGPCLVMLDAKVANRRLIRRIILPAMKAWNRWEDLYCCIIQLILGTAMILHARKLRLCERHFHDETVST